MSNKKLMKEIHSTLLDSCSKKTKLEISIFLKLQEKIYDKNIADSEKKELINKIIKKYNIKTDVKEYSEYFVEVKKIEDKNLTVRLSSDGSVEFSISRIFGKNLNTSVAISFNDIESYGSLHVSIYKSEEDLHYDFSIVENNEITGDNEINAYNNNTIYLNTIFPKNNKEANEKNNKIKDIMTDVLKLFFEPHMMKDIIMLKYDIIVNEDDILNIIYNSLKAIIKSIDKPLKRDIKIN